MIILLLIGYFIYFGGESYIAELLISFLPYRGGVMLLCLIISLFHLRKFLYKRNEGKKIGRFSQFSAFFVVGFGIIFLLFLNKFNSFYNHYQLDPTATSQLKIFYSNIYKGNTNYDELITTINQENPDLTMFVEFEEHHYNHIKDFLKQKFAYIEYLPWSTSIIASKYPITLLPTSVQGQKWRYHYFRVDKGTQTYLAYLIHTSSPTSKNHFEKRNLQLKKITEDFRELHQSQRNPNAKIFMIGDFNITPWSKYYGEFTQKLSGSMDNATRAFPAYFSWNLAKLLRISDTLDGIPELFHAHIDHIMVSPSIKIKNLNGLQLSGSDHRGFVFEME